MGAVLLMSSPRTTVVSCQRLRCSYALSPLKKMRGGSSASLINNHIHPTCRNVKKQEGLTSMQSILSKAIEPGTVKVIAPDLHISDRNLYRWMEGEGCPVNRLTQLVRILYVHNPTGAGVVMAHVNAEYEALLAKHGKRPSSRELEVSLHKETSEAVQAILAGESADKARKELLEARAAIDASLRELDQREAEERERRAQPRLKAI
jgi:hypothetical protein